MSPSLRRPSSMSACFTHSRTEVSVRSRSRATRPTVFPGWRTSSTTSALKSFVDHRLGRRTSCTLCCARCPSDGRVDGLDDHPTPGSGAASLALRLLPAPLGRIVHEVEDAAPAGDLVLPAVQGPGLVAARSVGPALESLLARRELGWVARQLVMGCGQCVWAPPRPPVPLGGHSLSAATTSHSSVRVGRETRSSRANPQLALGRLTSTGGPERSILRSWASSGLA